MAALDHPNIVAVYDVGSEDGIAYIVSELVDGESLRGAKLPLRKTLDIAGQIADGLACAYEAGIVDRRFEAGEHSAGRTCNRAPRIRR